MDSITETPAFKEWFKGSKVVDENGNPIVCYHGTDKNFSSFDFNLAGTRDTGFYGAGMYFSPDPGYASGYPLVHSIITKDTDLQNKPTTGKNVIPVFLKLTNPFIANKPSDVYNAVKTDKGKEITRVLKSLGFDGVVKKKDGKITEIVAFYPQQIKSAYGNKTFSSNSNITEQYIAKYKSQSTFKSVKPDNSRLQQAYKVIVESTVRDYIQANDYIVHGTDTFEKLKNIVMNGLRPKTQISNYEGQGLSSGPYILVYPNKQTINKQEVDYRVGDYMGAKVKGKPILILFDIDEIADSPPIEELKNKYIAASERADKYLEEKYPGVITERHPTENYVTKHDWHKFSEMGGYSDRVYKNLCAAQRIASDHYFYALDNEEYQPKTNEDYFNELKAFTSQYHIPVKKIRYDDKFDDFVFVK